MSRVSGIRSPVLVGRDLDLGVMKGQLESLAHGVGGVVLISGEAGIGKTRLLAECRKWGSELGLRALVGVCFETDRAVPYAPLLDLLHSTPSESSAAAPPGGLRSTSRELAEAVGRTGRTHALEPAQEKYRLFQALARSLIAQAQGGLVVILEDLHWSDDTSLEFLLHFASRLNNHPILLLLTYRSDELTPGLNHFLAELDRRITVTELPLQRLTLTEAGAMLQAVFELKRPVHRDFLEILHRFTDGNPFFIEEVLKSLITTGGIYRAEGVWDRKPVAELEIPRSVREAVRGRAERLTPSAREVLSVAAVIGQRFEFAVLQSMTAKDEESLLTLLKELIEVQLIVEQSGERFAFRHALTREAVYSQLLERERRRLHQAAGEAIESLHASAPDDSLANLAQHFTQAHAWEKALDYGLRAGRRAQALYSPQAAIEHWTHAIQAAEQLGRAPLVEAQRARGAAYDTLGDFGRARADYDAALRAARAAADHVAEWRCLMSLGMLWTGRDYTQAGTYFEAAHELARQVGEPQLLAHSLNRLGNWKANMESPAEALENHHAALALFGSRNDFKGLAETHDLLGMANYIHGDLVESESHYEHALQIFREIDDRTGLASSLASMVLNSGSLQSGMAVLAGTDPRSALEHADEALRTARDIGWQAGEVYALIILGNYHGVHGRYSIAFEAAQASLDLAVEIEHSQWITYASYGLGLLYFDVLALHPAREHFSRALDLARQLGSRWWLSNITGYLAQVLVSTGDDAGAEALLGAVLNVSMESVLASAPVIHASTLGQRLCWAAVGHLAISRGLPETALSVSDQLIASALNASPERGVLRILMLRARALMALGRHPEAERLLLTARQLADGQQEPASAWRLAALLSHTYQHIGRRQESESAAEAAESAIAHLADDIPDGQIRLNFLDRAHALVPHRSKPTARQLAKKASGGLTAREQEVAALVASGRSNREIAEALVVSERTAETHVGNILHKLGLSSRAQVAAWSAQRASSGGEPG